MAFSELERTANHAALKWFLSRHEAPAHLREQLDFGYSIVGHTVDIFEIRPDWQDKKTTRHTPVARMKLSELKMNGASTGCAPTSSGTCMSQHLYMRAFRMPWQ
jgi:hypothetical protein